MPTAIALLNKINLQFDGHAEETFLTVKTRVI